MSTPGTVTVDGLEQPGLTAERPVSKWLAWSEVALALWLYYLLIVVAIAAPPFIVPAFGVRLDLRGGTAVTLGGTLLAEAAALLTLAWWMRRRQLSFRDIGFVKPSHTWPVVVACCFALVYAGWTLMIPEVRANAMELGLFKLWGVIVSVSAAVVEEAVFRGFMMNELARAGHSRGVQLVVSAITFALLHMGFGMWGMACTLVMGGVLGLCYLWNGRSLAAPVAGHCIINALIEPWLLLYVITYYARMFGGG